MPSPCKIIFDRADLQDRLPECFVRCDVAHTLKLVASWASLKGKYHKIRTLYIRSIAQIVQSKSIEDIIHLLEAIITVALSDTDGINELTGETTHCEKAKHLLKLRIATGCKSANIEEDITSSLEGSNSIINLNDGENILQNTPFEAWLKRITDAVKQKITKDK